MQSLPGAGAAALPAGPAVSAATLTDAPAMARLHASQLPHGFFGRLGEHFLADYHATFVASPHAVALVATSGNGAALTEASEGPQIDGFLVGTVSAPADHTRWVLREHGRRLAVSGALALTVRPAVAARFLRTRSALYARRVLAPRGRQATASGPAPQIAVLTHVAVDPATRGTGVGTALVDAFVDSARHAGAQRAVLVTLDDGRGAGRFYERLGWQRTATRRDRDGHPIAEYSLALR